MTPERLADLKDKTCGELTCDECNERRDELIAALEASQAEVRRLSCAIINDGAREAEVFELQQECERLKESLVMAAEFYKLPGPEFDAKYSIANADEFVARIDAGLESEGKNG